MKVLAGVCLVALFTLACDDDCEPTQTRCDGVFVELCDADGNWHTVMNCGDIQGGSESWACCSVALDPQSDELDYTCLPQSECKEESR